jgi:hypothetical protein
MGVHKHYAGGGPSTATCAWCGQGFSANNFHSAGTWSVAVPGSARFTTPSRSTGGRARAPERYFVQSLIPLPAARRLSPWPTSRRLCSGECLGKARAQERAMLEQLEHGGATHHSTQRRPPRARSASPAWASTQAFGIRSLSPAWGGSSYAETRAATTEADAFAPAASKGSAGMWLGVLTVKIDSAVGLVVHEVGHAAESTVYDSFCVAVCGRQQRSTGLVKDNVNPHYGEEFVFDVYDEDVPVGFLAAPDRRERKKAELARNLVQEELQTERRQRAALLRRISGQKKSKSASLLPAGTDLKGAKVPWDSLCVVPGPNNCNVSIAVFHRPADPALPLESLGQCSISALDLLRNGQPSSVRAVGRLVHPDPTMVARGIIHVSIQFKPAKMCAAIEPQKEDALECGVWHKLHSAGTHPRPRSVMQSPAAGKGQTWRAELSTSPEKLSGAFVQTKLLEDLPWKRVEHEAEWKVKVRAWDKVLRPAFACRTFALFLHVLTSF